MNKNAQAIQYLPFLLVGIVLIFIFAIIVVPMADVTDRLIDELGKPSAFGNSNVSNASMNQVKNLVTPAFDQLIFILMIGVILGLIMIAIFSDFDPVLITVIIIAMVFFVIISYLLSQVYVDISQNEAFEGKADDFTLTNAVMGPQLPIIIFMAGIIMLVILFAKKGRVISPV